MIHLLTALAISVTGLEQRDTIAAADTSQVYLLYEAMGKGQPAQDSRNFRFLHRKLLYEALHIPASSPDSVVSRRMQIGWQQLEHVRASAKDQSPVLFHELLRESLKHQYGPLLLDAARWKVDLNHMDMQNRRTLMDELEEVYRTNSSTQHAEWLREYKKILEAAGAKYFAELNYHMQRLAKSYQRIRPPRFGMYAVQRNGKWGWVDEKGKTIIPLRYKAVRFNTNRLFEVSQDGRHFELIAM